MTTLYIVDRDSADGPETDCFTSLKLAEEWAAFIEGDVREENTIDRETLNAMKEAQGLDQELFGQVQP